MIPRLLLASALLLIVLAAGLFGGGGLYFDQAIVRHFVEWRARHPQPTSVAIAVTYLGGAPVLVAVALGSAILAALRDRAAGTALFATALGGRLLTEFAKWAVGRPRPSLDAHPVSVFSQSFPSAHAANSMITYGAVALFALPPRWRVPGMVAALALSLTIGSTRPLLGVHWPSDVVGGWCLGLLWLLACWTAWERVRRPPA